MHRIQSIVLVCVSLLAGCAATRSISDSGYRSPHGYGRETPLYRGELDEFDVLDVEGESQQSLISDQFYERYRDLKISLPLGSKVMVLQSGAMIPDEGMLDALGQHFSLVPLSGAPPRKEAKEGSFNNSLRVAAAKGGVSTIIVYWGVLESAQVDTGAKVVSWVPIAGYFVPDEKQEMRIRLKIVVMDVKTGRWEMLTPEVHSDSKYSAMGTRESSDQSQVALLKQRAYASASQEIVSRFAN